MGAIDIKRAEERKMHMHLLIAKRLTGIASVFYAFFGMMFYTPPHVSTSAYRYADTGEAAQADDVWRWMAQQFARWFQKKDDKKQVPPRKPHPPAPPQKQNQKNKKRTDRGRDDTQEKQDDYGPRQ